VNLVLIVQTLHPIGPPIRINFRLPSAAKRSSLRLWISRRRRAIAAENVATPTSGGRIAGYAAAKGHDDKSEDEIRAELGDKFPKHIYHSIICIGALIAHQESDQWIVDAIGAPHVGERSERDLIAAFVDKIAALNPQLVTFNGSSFDLPVLRYRAMVHKVPAIGLSIRPYFHRYTDDAVDLCDVLSSFAPSAKATLHELCRVMGLPGKPCGIDGTQVVQYYRQSRIREIAEYCETDVINTYRVWLRHELFQGKLGDAAFNASETRLEEFLQAR
jgi:predicted PolB exonuclease-like 3'-5' exonuclease